MPPQLRPGTPVSLTRIADHAPLPEGLLATPSTVFIPRGSAGLLVQGPSVLAVGKVSGRRVVAEAEYFASQGTNDIFRLCGEWRWVETRRHPRYDTRLPATVRTTLGLSRQPGTLLNLSAGGAAIQVAQTPESSDCDLVLNAMEVHVALPVRIIHARAAGRGLILHLEFEPLTSAQDAFLHDLLAHLKSGTPPSGESA